MDTRIVRRWLPYFGFACLLVGMFGMGRILPAPIEIGALAVAVLSYAAVLALYFQSKEKTNRVARKSFWTFMGSLFAVALFIMQITVALPKGWNDKHPELLGLLLLVLWLPLIIVGIFIQVRRWHDINASGWWMLINAIPYLGSAAAIIVCGFIPGTRGPNRFGSDPLGRVPRPLPPPPITSNATSKAAVAHSLDHYEQHGVTKSSPAPVAAQPPRTAASSSLENELRSLAALKADGIISEEEFTAKKRALLGL